MPEKVASQDEVSNITDPSTADNESVAMAQTVMNSQVEAEMKRMSKEIFSLREMVSLLFALFNV